MPDALPLMTSLTLNDIRARRFCDFDFDAIDIAGTTTLPLYKITDTDEVRALAQRAYQQALFPKGSTYWYSSLVSQC